MGDFFLLQMDDLFTEGVCFDNRTEGDGGPSGGVPHSVKASAGWPGGVGPGQNEGPEPRSVGAPSP
jgi:hypothetical protein